MKTALLVSVLSISLLAPSLFATSDAKLSGGVTKTLTGKTTSFVQNMRKLVIPFLALTAAYKIVIEPASIAAYKKVGTILSKSNNYNSWFAFPFQCISKLWNLPIPQKKCIDISRFATHTYVDNKLGAYTPNLSQYVTQTELQQCARDWGMSLGQVEIQHIAPLIARVEDLEKAKKQIEKDLVTVISKETVNCTQPETVQDQLLGHLDTLDAIDGDKDKETNEVLEQQ